MTDPNARSVYPNFDKGASASGDVAPMPTPNADPSPAPMPRAIDSLGFVMDVPVELTVELGRKNVRIADVLRLGPGSVLELTKANGEPLDIFVNNRLVARGEAVVVGERYGIRLTEVLVLDDTRKSGASE
jgi:flagellar motor switch protein FliN/FliY